METARPGKLKRGLGDLSPLFRDFENPETADTLVPLSNGVECVSVFSPDSPDDSMLLNTFLASRLVGAGVSCSVISFKSFFDSNPSRTEKDFPVLTPETKTLFQKRPPVARLKHHTLGWDRFEDVCKQSGPREALKQPAFRALFLDFDFAHVPCFEKVIPILDKWIVFVRPTAESLHEAYKMFKAMAILNHRLEYYLLYDGLASDRRGELLFERFSEMAARRIGIHLVWLGHLHFLQGQNEIFSKLALEHLFLKSAEPHSSIEKLALANLSQPAEEILKEMTG